MLLDIIIRGMLVLPILDELTKMVSIVKTNDTHMRVFIMVMILTSL